VKGHKEEGPSSTTTTATTTTEVAHLDEEDEAEKVDQEAIKELALHRSV